MKLSFLLCVVFVCAVHYADSKGLGGGGQRGSGREDEAYFKDMSTLFEDFWGRSSLGSPPSASAGYSGDGSGELRSFWPSSSSGYSRYNPRSSYPDYPGAIGYPSFLNARDFSSDNPRANPSHNTKRQSQYVKPYRSSTSRYNDLVMGLFMYNEHRASVFPTHHYRDSFDRLCNDNSSSSKNTTQSSPTSAEDDRKDEVVCLLKVEQNQNVDILRIPCVMVTTFGEGERKISDEIIDVNTTICVKLLLGISTSINPTKRNDSLQKNKPIDISLPGIQKICKSIIKTVVPISVTGVPLNTADMKCTIVIWKADEVVSQIVSCKTLVEYSKMYVQEDVRSIRPALVPPTEIMGDREKMFSSVYDLPRSNRRKISLVPQGDAYMSSRRPEPKQTDDFWTNYRNREAMLRKIPNVTPNEMMASLTELFADYLAKNYDYEQRVQLPLSRNMDEIKMLYKPEYVPTI